MSCEWDFICRIRFANGIIIFFHAAMIWNQRTHIFIIIRLVKREFCITIILIKREQMISQSAHENDGV